MGAMTLRLRWLGWRNRLLADPAFQRRAAAFPLTRPIARRQARALFDVVAGFVWSQTLVACVELGLFDALAQGPREADELAAAIGLPGQSAERLFKAAAALGLIARVGGRVMLGEKGAALVGNPGVIAMIRHHRALYADLADPVALLRRGGGGGALAGYWPYASGAEDDAATDAYSRLMAASQPMIAAQALAAYDFSRHHRLLDVGGGTGAFLRAVGARAPALGLMLFDLPTVIDTARAAFAGSSMTGRLTLAPGDMLADALPTGADIVTLVRVLHDHDDSAARALLGRVRAVLPRGGTLLIIEPMTGTPGAGAVGDAYFGWYLFAMGSGRARTPAEYRAFCREAGFRTTRVLPTPIPLAASIVIATA